MELQIGDLVSSIKKEGIEAARKEHDRIVKEAEEKAAVIIGNAKEEAAKTVENATKEINILKQSAALTAEQAKRDALISFKAELEKEFKKILAADIKKTLNEDYLGKLIKAAVADEDVSRLTVELKDVKESVKASLAQEIKKGLEIKPVKDIDAGFRIAQKDGSGFFDCSDEEIAEILAPFFGNITV